MKAWLAVITLAISATACTTSPAPERAASAANAVERIVGTWRLASYTDQAAGRPVEHPFGEHPKGLLFYDARGNMAIQIMKTPHPRVASGDEYNMTPAEKIALLDAYVAYFGTYTVDAKRQVVIHHVQADSLDVYIGTNEERPYELSGDWLVLKPVWESGGVQWEGSRVFQRLR